jgi:hypothetical protein
MTSIAETPLARLESEHRLINGNIKEPGSAPGSFLFRGELAIRFAQPAGPSSVPTELKADQVMLSAMAGQKELPFYTCHLQSFESLKPMTELLGDMLGASGKYFVFCSDIKFAAKYRVKMGAATFYVLSLDDNTSFNELLELLKIERASIKKRNSLGKLEAVADSVTTFNPSYEQITYERGLEIVVPAN